MVEQQRPRATIHEATRNRRWVRSCDFVCFASFCGSGAILNLPNPGLLPQWRRGAELAERLRQQGYPAPVYVATGATSGATWSLQELLPGEIPPSLTVGFAEFVYFEPL